MCGRYKDFILLLCFISCAAKDLKLRNCTAPNNVSIISDALVEKCPANSQCLSVNSSFKCICLPDFQHQHPNLEPYCQLKNASESNELPQAEQTPKIIVYVRSPARTEYLVFAILLILLAVISAVGVMYVIKLMKPLKRTKIAYVKLKRRSNNHRRLVEEEVYDGIVMNRRNGVVECY